MEPHKHSAAHSSRSAASAFNYVWPFQVRQTGFKNSSVLCALALFLWDCARGGQNAVRVHIELISAAAVGLWMCNPAQLFKGQTGSCC